MDHGFTTSWEALGRAAAGSEAERDQFARRYGGIIRSYLRARWYGTPNAGEIDDAVQEVFCECFRDGGILARADRERPGGFRAFLFGAIRNVARRVEERGARAYARNAPVADPERVAAREHTLSQLFDREWARSLLQAAAEHMGALAADKGQEAERRVQLLELRFGEGVPIRDIAKLWGVSAEQLHRQHTRAKAEYRDALAEVVAQHHPELSRGDVERECRSLLDLFALRPEEPPAADAVSDE